MNQNMLFAKEDQMTAQTEDLVDAQKFLVFMCDNLKLGVVAEWVVEILNNQVITYLPMMPEFIRGIINMRGQMIPIVDVRRRLGKIPLEDEVNLIIVLYVAGTHLGILADAVDQMIDIPKANILPIPAQTSQFLVSGMCSLPDGSGTMMVLDCEQLLPHD